MTIMDTNEKKATGSKTGLLERLRDPIQLRALITIGMVLAGYGGIYYPLDSSIAETKVKLAKEQKRLDLACNLEHLREQFNHFKTRLPQKPDSNEWVQHLLEGIRRFPVNLVALNAEPPKDVGPYKAIVLRIELEGGFLSVNALLRWLETNDRLCRVDLIKIVPHQKDERLVKMQLTVLGVMG